MTLLPNFRTYLGIAVLLVVARLPLSAEDTSTCATPPYLGTLVSAHPTASAYAALGAYFGEHGQSSCAIGVFRSAARLAPRSWESHYNLGGALLAGGDPDEAVAELQEAARLNPNNARIEGSLGTALAQLNRNDEAIAAFRAALRGDPQSIPALDGLAKALIAEKRNTAAIESLKNAPRDEALELDLAIAYERDAQIDAAIEVLTRLVKEHGGSSAAHVNLGVAFTRQSRYREAQEQFAEAFRLDPSDDATRVEYLETLIINGQYETAAPLIRAYLSRRPMDFEALYLAGVVERSQKDFASAEDHLKHAVALNPDHYEARYNLGFVLARLGRPVEAREQLETALRLRPDSTDARFQLVQVLRALGEDAQAREELQQFEREKTKHVAADMAITQQNQANEALEAGNVPQAIALYRQAIAGNPDNPHVYYDLAHCLDRQGDYQEERDALRKAIELNTSFAPAHNQLGLLHLRAAEMVEAETQFKAAIALDAHYAEAQNNLGVLYAQRRETVEAERLFRQAIENQPKYDQPYINLGLILVEERRFSEAEKTLHGALALSPQNEIALAALRQAQSHTN